MTAPDHPTGPPALRRPVGPRRRLLGLAYGTCAYLVFFGSFVYTIGFLTGWIVPNTIDAGHAAPLDTAVAVNLALLGVFGLQHSVMARPTFKRWWARFVAPSQERQTYVLASALALLAVGLLWHPIGGDVYDVRGSALGVALTCVQLSGFGLVLVATIAIDHFELFGLSQTLAYVRGEVYVDRGFRIPWLYRFVRHPIQLGFLIASWATPHMTAGHVLFAVVITTYILVALRLEERNLVETFGDRYRNYRKHVAMLLPLRVFRGRAEDMAAPSGA